MPLHHFKKQYVFLLLISFCYVVSKAQRLEPQEQNGSWGFFTGPTQVVDFKYDRVGKDNRKYYLVRSGQWGVLDANGNEIISCKYDTLLFNLNHGFIASLEGPNLHLSAERHETSYKMREF